jgi:NAD(P)-dependent dehydrogenase (short-subunit alcohol dehydrogenase family)
VSVEQEVAWLIDDTARARGLDILVNNAGVFRGGAVDEVDSEDLERELSVNFTSVVWGIKHASRCMRDGCAIVSVASHAGLRGVPTYGGYVASKAAVIGYTKTAALELAARGIRVNCVCPGTHETDMNREVDAGLREMRVASLLQPLGRCGRPEELAALVHFLVSPDCAFITGQAIPIDGGKSAGPGPAVIAALEDASKREEQGNDHQRTAGAG